MTYYRCPGCGVGFAGPKKQAICGPCNRRQLRVAHRDAANAYQRHRYHARMAALTPEQRTAQRARWRANWKRRRPRQP